MTLDRQLSRVSPIEGFIWGAAPAIRTINEALFDIAQTNIPVLLTGESGTGKELYARVIHKLSAVSSGPLNKVNCIVQAVENFRDQVLPKIQGTDSDGRRTFFLDEIDSLDLGCQRLLLTVLPDGQPIKGGLGPSARLISATSRDLEQHINAGWFRRDLYHRINGVCINLPPLRERKEDIPALVAHFFEKYGEHLKRPSPALSVGEMDLLSSYGWPGNIRELENVIKKIITLGNGDSVLQDLRAIDGSVTGGSVSTASTSLKVAARAASRRIERELIFRALERTRWNRKQAAHDLQISYKSLLNKLKEIGVLDKESIEKS